jgi:hypothetical protein
MGTGADPVGMGFASDPGKKDRLIFDSDCPERIF